MTRPTDAAHDHDHDRDPHVFWEDHYARQPDRFRGNPNALAVDHLGDLTPGTALELGAGQGADAIWLARRGWRVTGLELSRTALDLAAGRARDAGVEDRIDWRRHDLSTGLPAGTFDLVLSSYTQSPVALPRITVLREAAERVAPGGALLVVGHSGFPSWAPRDPGPDMPDADALVAALRLPSSAWTIDVREDVQRPIEDPDGRPATRQDSVVRWRRRG